MDMRKAGNIIGVRCLTWAMGLAWISLWPIVPGNTYIIQFLVVPRLFPVIALSINQSKFSSGDALIEGLNKVAGNNLIRGHRKAADRLERNQR